MRKPTVLVLGAYGQAGKSIVSMMVAGSKYNVIAAGRKLDLLDKLRADLNSPGLSVIPLDLGDGEKLKVTLQSSDIVVNCIGPYLDSGKTIAKAALENGVHYLDLAAEQEHYRRLHSLAELAVSKNLTLGTGFGLYPGVSGLFLLKMMKEIESPISCLMSLYQGIQPGREEGMASFLGALLEMNYDMQVIDNGKLKPVFPCSVKRVNLPEPFGEKDTMLWPQLEILSLNERVRLDRFETSIKIGLGPVPSKNAVRIIRLLKPHQSRGMYKILSRIIKRRKEQTYRKEKQSDIARGAIVAIKLRSEKTELNGYIFAESEDATAYLPVEAIDLVLGGKHKGLITPDKIFNPDQFFSQLKTRLPSTRWQIEKEC